jgi:arsenite/tail-anchored protein-transporting ATPase
VTFLQQPTRFAFFTGKGGVGKTSLACATAIRLADAGRDTLLVSTDPASNLEEMFGVKLSGRATLVAAIDHLFAANIDPEQAADAYRERVIAPYRGVWTDEQIAGLREELAGACTTEIAAFDEFAALLAGDAPGQPFAHVLFDTAPTGHTLRLLSLPRAWVGFLESTTHGASCLGPHSGLKMQQARFTAALAALGDATRTTVLLVSRPDRAALREADRTAGELAELGLRNQELVINGVFSARDPADPVAAALERRGREALRALAPRLQGLPVTEIPLRGFNMVGVPALRALLDDRAAAQLERSALPVAVPPVLPPLDRLIDEIAAPGRGLVMVMGKGGVGKTTIAAAIAAELASRGHSVHLSTTDPAAHVAAALADPAGNLEISRIDPAAETRAYVERVMATRGAGLDEEARALLAEDLRSPCYEEVAVFAAFSRIVSEARGRFVVLDTAPTGHTLLLLDAAGSYHRQMVKSYTSEHSGRIITPLMRLRDPGYSKILIVALAETTPVSEAARLQADLRRARIEPYAWVINASLAAAGSSDPCLQQRTVAELEQIRIVQERHARRIAIVPWLADEPVGRTRLLALARVRSAAGAERGAAGASAERSPLE